LIDSPGAIRELADFSMLAVFPRRRSRQLWRAAPERNREYRQTELF